jgi:hypothetical protein
MKAKAMRTLTAYGIGVGIVLAILNGIVWRAGTQRPHELNVFLLDSSWGCSGRILRTGFMGIAGSLEQCDD